MKVVLWKMGSLEYKIFPSRSAIDKLTEILRNLPDEGINHLVWGPDITVEEVEISPLDVNVVTQDSETMWLLKYELQTFVENWFASKTKVVGGNSNVL